MDVLIVGAGPVGATLGVLLARSGVALEVIEARAAPSADARTLALSHASRERLDEIAAWPATGVTAIASIHISQRGGPGRTLIEAREQGLPALGYTVPFASLEASLLEALRREGVRVHFGEACAAIELAPEAATVRLASGGEMRARLLVLADGGSNARRIPGLGFVEKDYGQVALVAGVHADRPHQGRAYERFTRTGPMALLPVADRYALVWTAAPQEAAALLALAEGAFLEELQARFGDRAGRFLECGPRGSFPLKLRTVNANIALRTALVGNAAQALHPIAGQGLNLGLRDACQLAATIAATAPEQLGSDVMLGAYRDARRRDAGRGVAFTDFLVSAFAQAGLLPTWGRGLALAALDLLPSARRALAQRMIHGAPAP